MQTVRLQLFISSPGDVAEERALTKRVIERLQGEFVGRAWLEPIYWEHEPLLATASFQEQIIKPSETDIVICILWSRLGTRLPPRFTRADGSRYASGTEFEFEDAALAHRQLGKPDLLVYRKTAEPFVSLKNKDALLEKLKQKESLDSFVNRWFHDHQEGTLVAAFHSFDSAAKFEELLEVHLRKLIEKQVPGSSLPAALSPSWQSGSPFRGLQSFEIEHAPIFFGRTKATSETLDALRQQASSGKPFVMVLGMSGSGKSSLVRAGILPMLIQPGVIEGIGMWKYATFRPSDNANDLLTGLANALLQQSALPELQESSTVEELSTLLRNTPQAVPALIKSALALVATTCAKKENLEQIPKTNLALVIDQLEELFTLPNVTSQERESFVNALDALARSGSVWVLATLRSDFYPRCAELQKLISLKEGAGQYDLLPPTPSEIGQLIRQPALAAGLRFEEDSKSGERLEDLLRDAAVNNPQVLPLLEFTLEELYNRRETNTLTLNAYRELGGVEGALAHRAETVFKELPSTVQAALPDVMQTLINVEVDGTATAKRALLNSFSTSESKAFVQAFVDARLLTSDLTSDKEAVVSVTHEALLRHWPRLVEWTQQNQDRLRLQGRLSVATKRWLEENRSPDFLWSQGKPLAEASELSRERLGPHETAFIGSSLQKGRRLRFIRRAAVANLAVLALVAGVAAFQANRQRIVAEAATRQANAETERAESEKQRAEEEKQRAESERQRAEEEKHRAGEETLRAEREKERAEKEATTAAKTREFLVNLFAYNDPSIVQGDIPDALELLDIGAVRAQNGLEGEPEVRAAIFNIIGKLYTNYGKYDKALPLLKEALELRRTHGTPTERLETLTNLGATQNALGNTLEGEALYREALTSAETTFGKESVEAADALSNLAVALSNRGDLTNAETLSRTVLEVYRQKLSESDPRLVTSLNNLAQLLVEMDNLSEAETLYREAIKLERQYNVNTPNLAVALSNLSSLLRIQGNTEEAEKLLQEAWEIQQQVLGETHPETLRTLSNLASLLSGESRFAEAEAMYRDILPKLGSTLGNHPLTAAVLNNLGNVLYEQSNYDEAKPLLERALSIYQTRTEANPADVVATLNNLAGVAQYQGDVASAESYFRKSLELEERIYGEDSLTAAHTRVNLAALLRDNGDYDAAETMLKKSLAIYQKHLGEESNYVAWVKEQLGTLYTLKGDTVPGETLLLEALELYTSLGDTNRQEVASTLNGLIALYTTTGELEKASTYTTQALEINRAIYGEDNIETISTMLRLAVIRESQERFDEAGALANEAATLLRPTLNEGDSRLDLALALVLEGRILLRQNHYLEAEPLLQEVLEIRRDELPEGHWQIASAESLLGDVYTSKGEYQQAEALLLPSYKVLSQEFAAGDQRNDDALERVIRLYKAWNKPELVRRYQAVKSSEQ